MERLFVFSIGFHYPATMSDSFLAKIDRIILENLEDDRFGVTELALKIGLSKSQLLRKIKSKSGKTVSEYLRDFRLDEARKLIKASDLTSAEVAYRVGFGSPSYFNKCFHEKYGLAPGAFKDSIDHESKDREDNAPDSTTGRTARSRWLAYLLPTMVVLLLGTAILKLYQNSLERKAEGSYAIAVLPFLNLSQNGEGDYLSDGLTEAITLHLSKNKSIRVISRGSAMTFKGVSKPYEEIAEILGVDLILEGSILFDQDSMRVVAQLIKPIPEEEHLWANHYDAKFDRVLSVVDDISNAIAREIKLAVLPPGDRLENYPLNAEAYKLYLKGRHLYNQQTPRSLIRAEEYLEESIKLDSNFAPAYATLAETYILMNKFIQKEEEKKRNVIRGRFAVDKALEKGPYLAEAYITKGNILGKFDWDWKGMKEMTLKGLELDPNNSYAHTQMSKYYLYTNQMDKCIEEALIAEQLDPLDPRAGCVVAEQYFYNKELEKSLEQFQKVTELHPDHAFAWDGMGYVQFLTGQLEESSQSYLKFQRLMNNHSMIEKFESGAPFEEAIRFWLEKAKGESPMYCSNPSIIAQVFLYVDEKELAMDYLEAAYVRHNEDLPRVLLQPHFQVLYDDARFLDLVDKTGISIDVPLEQ